MKTIKTLALALFCAGLVLVLARQSEAFTLAGPLNHQTTGSSDVHSPDVDKRTRHWDLREFPSCRIPYSFGNHTPDTNAAGGGVEPEFTEIIAAFNLWQAVVPAVIQFNNVPPGPGASCPLIRDNNNIIGWNNGACGNPGDDTCIPAGGCACGGAIAAGADIIGPGADGWLTTSANNCPGGGDDQIYYNAGATQWRIRDGGNMTIETLPNGIGNLGGAGGTLALTGAFYILTSGNLLECDILFNDAYTWVITADQAATPTSAEVQTVAAHEIGHFIGLHHVPSGPDADVAPFGNFPGAEDTDINGDGVLDTPMMDSPLQTAMHHLHNDDRDGCNFIYNPDLGDAPDGPYTSLIHGGAAGRMLNGITLETPRLGPMHLYGIRPRQVRNYTYEWIGPDLTGECESNQVNADPNDDGMVLHPVPAVRGAGFAVDVQINTAADAVGNRHNYAAIPMYLNIWADWNGNGTFEPGPPEQLAGPADAIRVAGLYTRGGMVPFGAVDPVWIRVRLDWGEDCGAVANHDGSLLGAVGVAQFGEVQDTLVPVIDSQQRYWDLGDIDPCNYVTLSDNPAHFVGGCVWLGGCITGEAAPNFFNFDPCDDGVGFLGLPWTPCTPVSIIVIVTAPPDPECFYKPMYFNFWKDGNLDRDFCDVFCDGAAPEWALVNIPVTAAGSPYLFTFIDPGPYPYPPYSLIARARLTSGPVDGPIMGAVGPCDSACWWAPTFDPYGEVEDYVLTDQQLSVALTAFEAVPGNNQITLRWSTASETNNDHFEISRDGEVIARVTGAGSSSEPHTYEWVDERVQNGTLYAYTLIAVDNSGAREELQTASATPLAEPAAITDYALRQNYPNPFNPTTQIEFDMKDAGFMTLKVFNLLGQEIASVISGHMSAGRHRISFDAGSLPSGVYIYRMEANGFSAQNKMLLMK